MKRKFTFLITAALMLLTMMATTGRMWGQTKASTTVSYGWENNDDASNWTITEAIAKTEGQGNTGSYAGKINTNHTYVQFNEKVNVTSFSFAFKRTSNNSNYNVYIETSTDGSTWTAVETYSMGSFNNGSYLTKSHTFDGTTQYYVRFHCYNTTAVRYVDDVSITYNTGGTPTVATPTFTPEAGVYVGTQSVAISCSTDNSTIYYTTDGTEPTTNSAVYSTAIEVSESKTIKAFAVAEGYDNSSVATANYTILHIEHEGTETDPYTVADARNAIDAGTGVTGIYATGIVSEIVTAYGTGGYNNMTFNMVDEAGDEVFLQAYRCVGDDAPNVLVGDIAVVTGDLTKYGQTYEFASGCSVVSLEHPAVAVATPTFSPDAGTYAEAQTVTMSCTTEGAAIHYTTDGTEPDGNSNVYSTGITVSETTTFKAKAIKGDDASNVVTATYHICSADAPYTVAQALAFQVYPANEIYVHGIVSTAPTQAPNSDGQLTYYISDNGEATNQLQVYKGKGLDNAAFTAQDDIQVGDIVTVYGNVVIYGTSNPIKEFASGNYLTSFERPVEPSITVANATVNVGAEGGDGTLTVTYENITTVAADIWFCNAAGTEEATYGWITASINADNNVEYLVEENDSNERTAYFKVWAYADDATTEVYSNLVTVTQAEYIAPTPSIAVTPTLVEAPAEGTDGTIDVTLTAIANNDIEVHWFESDGTTAATYNHDWIETNIDPNNDIAYVIEENTGDARSAYFKVYGLDGEANAVYSELVTINQAAGTTPPTPGNWDWVLTDLANLTANDVFVIVGTETGVEEDAYFALPNNGGTQNAPSAVSVTVSNNTLSGEIATTIQWNISGNSTDGYIFYPNGDTETWLYCNTSANSGSNNNMRVGSGDRKYFVLDENDYIITNDNSVTRYLSVYNDQDWRGYIDTSHGAVPISFYKRIPASTEPSITINPGPFNVNSNGGDAKFPINYANLAENPQLTMVFVDADGVTPHTYDWISAEIVNDSIRGHIQVNEGEARTAYFKVAGNTVNNDTICSNIARVNQSAAAAPSIVFETDSMDIVAGGEQDRKLSFDYEGLGSTPTFTINYYESDGTTAVTAATYDWLTATIEGDKLNITAVANTGEARSAYLKVYGEKNANVHAESNLVTINQAEYVASTYTVTYVANGGTGTMTDPNSPYVENAEVTLLENTFTAPEGMKWDAWLVEAANQTPIEVNEGKFNMPASDVTVTAQWVVDPDAPTYEWVLTTLEDLTSSDIFVIVGNNDNNYAMANDNGNSAPAATAVIIANNKLSDAPDNNLKWNISGNANDGYIFYPNGSTTTWLYCINNNNGLKVGGSNSDNTFEIKDDYLYNKGQARYIGIYNSSDWRSYTSINNNIKDQTFGFYKRQQASTDPHLYTNDVNIESDATEGEIAYTLENPNPTGNLTAEITDGNEGNWLTLGTVGATVPFTCLANIDPTVRTATVTLTYSYGETSISATAVVTQAALIVDYATMPFAFDGGRADIENVNGLTQEGLDTDYSSSPKLKFKNEGTSVTLKLNEAPVSIVYDIKGNSFSGSSTFKVQVSEDGSSYTDLKSYNSLGNLQTELINNDNNAIRYIKWIYTTKDQGNVALGNIKVYDVAVTIINNNTTINDLTIGVNEGIVVSSDVVLTLTGTVTNTYPEHLIIEDGGQLIVSNPVAATMQKTYVASGTWGSGNSKGVDGWYLISSPVGTVNTSEVGNLTTSDYDLYAYNEPDMMWYNAQGTAHPFLQLVEGEGYLYSSKDGGDATYSGEIFCSQLTKTLSYTSLNDNMAGWNLLGNPYSHNITWANLTPTQVNETGYYTLGFDGNWSAEPSTTAVIKPMQGFLVRATAGGAKVVFNNTASKNRANSEFVKFIVSNGRYEDATYAMYSNQEGLDKINHRNAEIPMLYIPQDGKKFAIATMSEGTEVFNLSFKAMTTGRYTLSFETEGKYSYLHVIDRLTGNDVDMLAEGKYEFIGSPRDNADRFIVKLNSNASGSFENDIFAYQNGSDVIVNGQGELQIFDLTGRMVAGATVNGSQTVNVPTTGVYIFRLVGNDVKTQKIVVK